MSDSAIPWTAERQAPPSSTLSQSLLNWICDSIQPSHPLPPPFSFWLQSFPASGSFPMRRMAKVLEFSFNISPSSEYLEFISFRIDWIDLLAVQGALKNLLQRRSSKASILWHSVFFMVQLPHPFMTAEKTTTLTIQIFVGKDCFFKDPIFKDSHIQRYWGLGLQYMGLGSQGGRFQPSSVICNVTLPNSHGLVTLNSFSINIRRFLSHSLNMCYWTWASMQGDKYSSSCSDGKQRHVQLNSHLRKPEWTEMPLSKCISLQTSGNCVWWDLGDHSLCAELDSILGNAQREGDTGEVIGTLTQRAFMSITRSEIETTAGVCPRVNRSVEARPSDPGHSAFHVKPAVLSSPCPALYSYPRGAQLISQIILLGSLFCLVTDILLGERSQASSPPSLRPFQGAISIIFQFPDRSRSERLKGKLNCVSLISFFSSNFKEEMDEEKDWAFGDAKTILHSK